MFSQAGGRQSYHLRPYYVTVFTPILTSILSPRCRLYDTTDVAAPCKRGRTSELFTLSIEIRNHIYRLAMFDSNDKQPFQISVDGVIAPPLVYTCKMIHREATGIFFAEAKFSLSMDSLDPEPLVRWCNRLRKLPKVVPLPTKLNVSFGLFFTRDWSHIRRWLQLYYNKHVRMILLPPTEEDRAKEYYFPSQGSHLEFLTIGSIFETVDKVMGKFSWTEVEAIIEPQHAVLTDVDKGWS